MPAQTRLRITAVKYGDSTFMQQVGWWREVARGNPYITRDKPFQTWLKDNWDKLVISMHQRELPWQK